MKKFLLPFVLHVLALHLFTAKALTQWSHSADTNNAICVAGNNQQIPTIVSDGAGGAIITWEDRRTGNLDIYAQKVNYLGVEQWAADGVMISAAPDDQRHPAIVSDGAGGAIITWEDYRNGWQVYAQRVNASGVVQWTADGILICTSGAEHPSPAIVSDGAGGAIITWQDIRGTSIDIYAQRVNASGVLQWATNGVSICTAVADQHSPAIVSDGAGGAIITWSDWRTGDADIYAQKVNASGVVQWTTNGVAISTAGGDQHQPRITTDGAGGAIITWTDGRWGWGTDDIYARRVNASGVAQWAVNGVPISTANFAQGNPNIVSDGAGGAIITWQQMFYIVDTQIFAQRVNASGAAQWTTNGIELSTGGANNPTIVSDGAGGAIITWQTIDIFAQRVSASGVKQWIVGGDTNGLPISRVPGYQYSPVIISDGAGGAIITWEDWRFGAADIYAQQVSKFGVLGDVTPPQPRFIRRFPLRGYNPYTAPISAVFDHSGPRYCRNDTVIDFAGEVATVRDLNEDFILFSCDTLYSYKKVDGSRFLNGIANYVGTYMTGDTTLNYDGHPGYDYRVNIGTTVFSAADGVVIVAHDIPSPGTGRYVRVLHNNGYLTQYLHLNDINVGVSQYVSAGDSLGHSGNTGGVAPHLHFEVKRIVGTDSISVDPYGWQGIGILWADSITGVELEEDGVVAGFSLMQNYPNPLNPSTTIRYELPKESRVLLKVYNILGQEVATLVNEEMKPGSYKVTWDATGFPSGVYFYRLRAGEFIETKKLLLLR